MTPKDKITHLMDYFGMTPSKASEAMNITVDVFRHKKSEKNKTHNFNEKNYKDLFFFIKNKAKEM
jgi:hypothetical protein